MLEDQDFAAAATIGSRDRQEDDWGTYAQPPALEEGAVLLAALADGMGGAPAGDRASGLVIQAFLDSYSAIQRPAKERLRHALAHANREIGIAIETTPELTGMGCTLVAALFFLDRVEWLSVGDSFILLCRGGRVVRINPLHTYARKLDERVRWGEISPECADRNPDRASLTSVVMGGLLEEVSQGELLLEPGDLVVLASDGIATLPEDELVSICFGKAAQDASAVAEGLVARIDALAAKGQDNATVIVVRRAADEADTITLRKKAPDDAASIAAETECKQEALGRN